jgi:hypothetical protein
LASSEDKGGAGEAELYELSMPGRLIGKIVVDRAAKIIGIVRSVRISLKSGEGETSDEPLKGKKKEKDERASEKLEELGRRVELIVKGLDVELPIDIREVSAVGSVVQLRESIKDAAVVELSDIGRLRKELWEEVRSCFIGK